METVSQYGFRMDRATFNKFCEIAYYHAGIVINPHKVPLVSARVGKRLRALGLKGEREYLDFLEQDNSGEELIHFLDTMSTNYTGFFREEEHFKFMAELVTRWVKKGQCSFKFWSAASSSGAEPYSMAIVLDELSLIAEFSYRILATDISTQMLEAARRGEFKDHTLAETSRPRMLKYFKKQVHKVKEDWPAETRYQIRERLRDHIVFARLNLRNSPYPMSGPFDIIFLRNVMIYFDNTLREQIIREVERLLRPGGYLFVGHSETLTGLDTKLKALRPSIYYKANDSERAATKEV